ncbi:MAG TPA: Calx-beta domain-containing protein, partial [Roseimicrobium sp.]|nr:Calx-beta domain-containing protein [Roseimicrobium sp.]
MLDHNTSLSISQYYDGSLHPTNPDVAIGGSQDNGTHLWTGTGAWDWIAGGDGAANTFSLLQPDTDWAVSSQYLSIRRTRDGGASYISATSGLNTSTAPFIARFAHSTSSNDVMIAGTDQVWRCNNFFSATTPTWTANSPAFGSSITALAFARADASANTYAIGTSGGSIRMTTDGGANWRNIDPANAVPNRYVTGLSFNPTNATEMYVTLSGFDEGTPGQPGHVFKTLNVGAATPAWSNVSPPVNLPMNAIAIDPGDTKVIYVGGDLGIWASSDAGTNWSHMGPNQGIPNVAVFDLQLNPTTGQLIAFTHGRGAYRLGGTVGGLPLVSISDVSVSEGDFNPSKFSINFSLSQSSTSIVSVAWSTSNGTATAGVDYFATNGVLNFAPGVTTMGITNQLIPNLAPQSNRIYYVNITNVSGAIVQKGTSVVTIQDDDGTKSPYALSIGNAGVTEGDSGTTSIVF